MADNRLYLKCNACNGILKLGRFNYVDGWHDLGDPIDMNQEFFNDHRECWFMLEQNQMCSHKHDLFSLEFEDQREPLCEVFPIKSWKEDVQ